MKFIKILLLLLFFVPCRIDASKKNQNLNDSFKNNPVLKFMFAAQAAEKLKNSMDSDVARKLVNELIEFENDDNFVFKLLTVMNNCIDLDKSLKKDLKSTQGFMGAHVNPTNFVIAKDLIQSNINICNDIQEFKKREIPFFIASRIQLHNQEQDKLAKYLVEAQKLVEQANSAKHSATVLDILLQQNIFVFEQALELYIGLFGQYYPKPGYIYGSYGSYMIISSKYDKKMLITPLEFSEFKKILQAGVTQFGSKVSIALDNKKTTTIHEVITCVDRVSSSYSYMPSDSSIIMAALILTSMITAYGLTHPQEMRGMVAQMRQDLGNFPSAVDGWLVGKMRAVAALPVHFIGAWGGAVVEEVRGAANEIEEIATGTVTRVGGQLQIGARETGAIIRDTALEASSTIIIMLWALVILGKTVFGYAGSTDIFSMITLSALLKSDALTNIFKIAPQLMANRLNPEN